MKSLRWWGIVVCALCVAMGNARAAEWFVATNGNDLADGTSWATAKQTIQAGVDATADGDTVWVSNGVYETGSRIPLGFTLENRVVITNDITVRSVDGPVATVIRGEGPRGTNAVRCVYMTAGELIGFTITNGHTRTEGDGNGDQNGGGLSIIPSANVVVSNCVFSGNSAYNAGGAIFGTFYNCVFSGNSAERAGGGVCNATLHNCVLVENTATEYGGGTDQCTMNNCTIVGNSAPNGGGVYNGTLNNCIAYLNVPANLVFSSCRYTRSDPLPSGIGNIAAVPWFLDAAAGNFRLSPDSPCIDAGSNTYVQVGTDLDGNPRIVNDTVDMGAYEFLWESPVLMIRPTSLHLPCESASGLSIRVTADVDWTATTNVPWLSITDGHSGMTNGTVVFSVASNTLVASRTGAIIVAGGGYSLTCTVVQAGIAPVVTLTPSNISLDSGAVTGITVDVTANLSWTASTDAHWLVITSGHSGTTNGTVLFNIDPNIFPVVRTGSIIIAGSVLSRTCQVIQAAGSVTPTNWYVATNGNDNADGMSWATAKQTIQAGIDAATNGETVWVSNGVYATGGRPAASFDTRVVIDKSVNVQSVNGPEVTIINANPDYGRWRAAYVANGAVLSGFTIIDGHVFEFTSHMPGPAGDGGGAYCEPDGILTNCVIRGNYAIRGGGVYGGQLFNCKISQNFDRGTYGSILNACLVESNSVTVGTLNNCLVTESEVVEAVLNNCTVTGNREGVGVRNCTVNNCIVYGNTPNNYAGSTFNYSCTTPDPGGTGNIANDPQFADAPAGNFRLSMGSLCINAGVNAKVQGTTDLDGKPRIIFGQVDMGAYECERIDLLIAPTRTNLSHGATSGNIEVVASVPWTATTTVPWLSITSGDSGTTNGTVVFHAEGNGSMASRRGAIIVSKGDFARTCTVVQAGAMTIAPTNLHLSCEATSGISIAVSTWAPWMAESTVPWLTISGASGISTGAVVIHAEANSVATTRTGTVMVTASTDSENPLFASIVQEGNPGWDVGSQDLGDGWRRLSWFGDYNTTRKDGWIWHNIHGFLQVSATATPGSIWFYAQDMGWLWTSHTQYPTLYRASDGAWLWFNGSSNPRWFMNLTTGHWERWPNVGVQADWYVTTNGNDAASGTSWATAKRTIQAAVDAATAGGRVWVSNGVYATGGVTNYPAGSTLTNRVAIYKLLTVQSVNGPEVTIIKGAWDPAADSRLGDAAIRCVYVGSNAVLSGFTLTNGATRGIHTEGYGGGAWCEASGVINHCRLFGNVALTGGGVVGGTLNFCTLADNRVDSQLGNGGGASGATLNDCVLSNNFAFNYGGGANRSTLNRCRLSQNRVAVTGSGAFDCLLNNCLLLTNSGGGLSGASFCTLNNCTVVSNRILSSTVNNGILSDSAWEESTLNTTYTGDPLFVDEVAGDYRLSNRSPCIDAGDNAVVQGEMDLDGNPRIVNGLVDQGAYEFQGTATYRGWASSITNGQTNDTDCAAGDGVPNLMKYAAGSPYPMVPDDLATLGLNRGLVPTLVFHRNPNAADLQWIIEGADVLSNGVVWRGLATNLNGSWGGATNVHESGTGTPVVCTVNDPVPLLTNRFLRLKVTRP